MTGLQTLDRLPKLNHLPELTSIKLEHLSLICIQGPQAVDFLQGQLTCDVVGLRADQWLWGAHCDAKGKMVASFRILKQKDALYMLVSKSIAPLHEMHLKKYAVFHQVEIHTVQACIVGLCGAHAITWLSEASMLTDAPVCHIQNGMVLRDGERAIMIHWDITELPEHLAQQSVQQDTALWQGLEILNGYPLFDAPHQGKFIPQMLNLDSLGGISLTKGCYIGQETVARMTYRGGNNKALFVLVGSASKTHEAGVNIEMKLDTGTRRAGEALQLYQEDHHYALTIVLRKDIDLKTQFLFADDAESDLHIVPCPYPIA